MSCSSLNGSVVVIYTSAFWNSAVPVRFLSAVVPCLGCTFKNWSQSQNHEGPMTKTTQLKAQGRNEQPFQTMILLPELSTNTPQQWHRTSSTSTSPLPELVTNPCPSVVSNWPNSRVLENNAFQSSTETGQGSINRSVRAHTQILSHQKPTAAQDNKRGWNSRVSCVSDSSPA